MLYVIHFMYFLSTLMCLYNIVVFSSRFPPLSLLDVLLRRNIVENVTSVNRTAPFPTLDENRVNNNTIVLPTVLLPNLVDKNNKNGSMIIHPTVPFPNVVDKSNKNGSMIIRPTVSFPNVVEKRKNNNKIVRPTVHAVNPPRRVKYGKKHSRFINLPTTPLRNYGNEPIDFFPWNDGVDYNEMCDKILNRITQRDTFYVVSDSIPGGLGHKYRSLLHSLTYAILTGRRFLMETRDSFWNETNSCLRGLRYTGPLDMFQNCGRKGGKCRHVKGNAGAEQPMENLVFRDFHVQVFSPSNLRIIHELGLIPRNRGWDYFKRILLRLVLNPSPYNIRLILDKKNELKNTHLHLSVHLRCAGALADKRERIVMLSPEVVRTIPAKIANRVKQLHIMNQRPNIYLSSDSSQVEEYIKKTLTSVNVYTLGAVKGHSTGGNNLALRTTLIDLYTLCLSDHFIGTSTSSFSIITPMVCKFRKSSSIRGSYRIVKSLPVKVTLYAVCFSVLFCTILI